MNLLEKSSNDPSLLMCDIINSATNEIWSDDLIACERAVTSEWNMGQIVKEHREYLYLRSRFLPNRNFKNPLGTILTRILYNYCRNLYVKILFIIFFVWVIENSIQNLINFHSSLRPISIVCLSPHGLRIPRYTIYIHVKHV